MIDVDKFKTINDTYGYIEGDFALKVVAESLKKTAAQYGAFAARYGGDEFCIILPESGAEPEEIIKNYKKVVKLLCFTTFLVERPQPTANTPHGLKQHPQSVPLSRQSECCQW